jgi:hypothetical protein
MQIEILELPHGYGYRVESVYQEFDPDCEGFVPMSQERAEECALLVKARLEA